MSEEKPLTSDEIVDMATEMVNNMRTGEAITNAEIVMVLDTAKLLQVQSIILDVTEAAT